MGLREELPERIATRVRLATGRRVGFTYAVVKTRREGNDVVWLDTPPEGMDWRTRLTLRVATSYWGVREVGALSRHLEDAAPRHSMIAGWNDDAWIATEDPEVILHMDGLD